MGINRNTAKTHRIFVASALSALLCGCAAESETSHDVGLAPRIDALESSVKDLRASQAKMQLGIFNAYIEEEAKHWAYLTPDSNEYQRMRTGIGYMVVILDDVRPYATGSKVKIRFGNPLSATITSAKATIDWGVLDAEGKPDYASQRSKEVSFIKPFRAGSWTAVDVALDGLPSDKLGFVRVKDFQDGSIQLIP